MIKSIKIILLSILLSLPQNSFSETNLTPWNFKITTSDNLIYAGHSTIDIVKELLINSNIIDKNKMNNFIKTLDSKTMIYIFSKNQTQNSINANTQPDTTFFPTNDSGVKKLCKDLNNKFNSLVKVELKLTNCNLEFYKNKISSEKFMDNLSQEIKSILFYSHVISGYDRNQLQYYIRYKNKLTTFTLGCKIGECEDMHQELIKIINSIEFV